MGNAIISYDRCGWVRPQFGYVYIKTNILYNRTFKFFSTFRISKVLIAFFVNFIKRIVLQYQYNFEKLGDTYLIILK